MLQSGCPSLIRVNIIYCFLFSIVFIRTYFLLWGNIEGFIKKRRMYENRVLSKIKKKLNPTTINKMLISTYLYTG